MKCCRAASASSNIRLINDNILFSRCTTIDRCGNESDVHIRREKTTLARIIATLRFVLFIFPFRLRLGSLSVVLLRLLRTLNEKTGKCAEKSSGDIRRMIKIARYQRNGYDYDGCAPIT